MTEDFLHYIWKNRLYTFKDLKTVQGQKLEVIHPGYTHQDSGPDFKQAVIKIDDITWAGDVEIHCKSSDWIKHEHHKDEKYQSVILHVVYESDVLIDRDAKETFPTLALKSYLSDELLGRYRKLQYNELNLPCEREISELSPLLITSWLSRLCISRLLKKEKKIYEMLTQCHGDWNELLFRMLSINFGFKANEPAFELLSKTITYKQISHHAKSRIQLYALLFGQAGFLESAPTNTDDYFNRLSQEYYYLRHKYKLISIPSSRWNLLRLHPQNFPCLRLAQLAELLHHYPDLFKRFITETDFKADKLLNDCIPDPYWDTHYHFGIEGKRHSCRLGKHAITLIQINTLIPALFCYGSFSGNSSYQEKAVSLLENLPFEGNYITKYYQKNGFPCDNAMQSQAIIELHHHYCRLKKCLNCQIGCAILQK